MLISTLLKTYETEDYQNRKGNYPKSDIPTSLEVYDSGKFVVFSANFKNTQEEIGAKWVENFLKKLFKDKYETVYIELDTCQEGEYQDDWINVKVKIIDKEI